MEVKTFKYSGYLIEIHEHPIYKESRNKCMKIYTTSFMDDPLVAIGVWSV
jgi:hypothetical protein